MQEFSGIERTTVEYTTWMEGTSTADPGRATTAGLILGSRGACSENGTTVTVTFDSISMEVGETDENEKHPRLAVIIRGRFV